MTVGLTSPPPAGTIRALVRDARPTPAIRSRGVAVGISRCGRRDYRLALRIQRDTADTARLIEQIRQQASQEVDVRRVGRIVKQDTPWHRLRQRPLLIGASIGHHRVTAGTLGCVVQRRDGALLWLSNNHVLADENAGAAGDPILQPGRLDGGWKRRDGVAVLDRFVRLKSRGVNHSDCALALPLADIAADPLRIGRMGKLAGLGPAELDEGTTVAKVGRTTGLTRGCVTAFEMDNVTVEYAFGVARFDDQIEIEGAGTRAFSDGGDSGSLIVDSESREAVGLLFAGSDEGGSNGKGLTYANPIHRVLAALKVELCTG